MELIREALLLSEALKGMNYKVPCTIRAVKVSFLRFGVWEHGAANIVN